MNFKKNQKVRLSVDEKIYITSTFYILVVHLQHKLFQNKKQKVKFLFLKSSFC